MLGSLGLHDLLLCFVEFRRRFKQEFIGKMLGRLFIFTLMSVLRHDYERASCQSVTDTVLPGHLKPLGSHRDPDPVDEVQVDEIPSPQDFYEKYVKPSRPLVFRGAAKKFPAFTKWTDDYLSEKYPKVELRMEGRREKFGRLQIGAAGLARDTLENFVSRYHDPRFDGYIVSELPSPMYPEVMVLPCMNCGTLGQRLVEVDFWMNGGNASSVLHKDAFNQMNCLLNGTKEWKLIEFKNEKLIYKTWEPLPAFGGYSKINVHAVDMNKYPKVSKVPWMFTTIYAGDCLFLPKSMWHHVNSYGTHNLAVSLLFSRFDGWKHFDFSDCKNMSNNFVPLSDLTVDWEYPGHGDMTLGNADLSKVRRSMYHNLNRNGKLTLKQLIRITSETYSDKKKDFIVWRANKTYQALIEGAPDGITKDIIRRLTKQKLREMAWTMERVEPSNAVWYEYNSINPDAIQEVVQMLLKKGKGKFTREKFVKKYVGVLEGTPKLANKFFDVLAGEEGGSEVTKENVKKSINKALEKYFEHQTEGELAAAAGKGAEIPDKPNDPNYDVGDVDRMAERERERRRREAEAEENEGEDNEDGDSEESDEEGQDPDKSNENDEDESGDTEQNEVQSEKDNDGEKPDDEKHDEL